MCYNVIRRLYPDKVWPVEEVHYLYRLCKLSEQQQQQQQQQRQQQNKEEVRNLK